MDLNSWEIVDSSNSDGIDENVKLRNDNKWNDDKKEEDISHPHHSSSKNRYGQNVKNYE